MVLKTRGIVARCILKEIVAVAAGGEKGFQTGLQARMHPIRDNNRLAIHIAERFLRSFALSKADGCPSTSRFQRESNDFSVLSEEKVTSKLVVCAQLSWDAPNGDDTTVEENLC